jgi:uncharacterized protein
MRSCVTEPVVFRALFLHVSDVTSDMERALSDALRQNTAHSRFELDVDGHTALAFYRLEPGVITFTHTEVPAELSGRGIGSRLIHGALVAARAQGLMVVAKCPFVGGYLAKHAEFNDLLL